MKSVLISIQPKWCELIASKKKTVEVRKTKPKLETPFKCYIYCTHNNRKNALHTYINSGYGRKNFGIIGSWRSGKEVVDVNSHLPAYRYNAYLAEGKVIGEFVCDRIGYVRNYGDCVDRYDCIASCLSANEIIEYAKDKKGNFVYTYGWHISDLVIYDKPRELREFRLPCDHSNDCCTCKRAIYCSSTRQFCRCDLEDGLKRPPQSWCYVEGAE